MTSESLNDPVFTVTDRGSIFLASKLRVPGDKIRFSEFAGYEAVLKQLVASGQLVQGDAKTCGIDVQRVDQLPPPLPNEIDLKAGNGPVSVAGGDEAATRALLAEIKEAQAARQKALADIGPDVSLTPEEAKALGLVN